MLRYRYISPFIATLFALPALVASASCPDLLKHSAKQLHSKKIYDLCSLSQDKKAILIVNTASHCGYTKQFKGLESLHNKYKEQGLLVVGFPSDSFNQEAKDEKETASVCYQNYGVTFPMTSTTSVKGEDAHPVFSALAAVSSAPSWNFNKFLVTPDGEVKHYPSNIEPLGSALENTILQTLQRDMPTTAKP